MRRGGATQSEGQAVWVVRDLHNPGREKTSETSVHWVCVCVCIHVFLCVFPHSLALVATSSRRERRIQKAWLIMVSTSEKGLKNSRSSLMVKIFLPTCRPAIWMDRRTDRTQNAVIFRLHLVSAPSKAPILFFRWGPHSLHALPPMCHSQT